MTPPDYKAMAAEVSGCNRWPHCEEVHCLDEIDRIATALTQADALGYARGRTEAEAEIFLGLSKHWGGGRSAFSRGPRRLHG